MDDVYTDPELAASQEEILALFHSCTNPGELQQKIANSGIQADLKAWLLSGDPDMLATAALLVRQWGSMNPPQAIEVDPPALSLRSQRLN